MGVVESSRICTFVCVHMCVCDLECKYLPIYCLVYNVCSHVLPMQLSENCNVISWELSESRLMGYATKF